MADESAVREELAEHHRAYLRFRSQMPRGESVAERRQRALVDPQARTEHGLANRCRATLTRIEAAKTRMAELRARHPILERVTIE